MGIIRRARIADLERVNAIMRDVSIYPFITEDGDPISEDFTAGPALISDVMWFVFVGDHILFFLHPRGSTTYEVHTMVLPDIRGAEAISLTIEAISWFFANAPCLKIETRIPFFNRRARAFALRCGMKDEGVSRKSFLKGSVLQDQWLMGITKEGWPCQQLQQ
jgi:hypothetical protein